MEWNRWLTALSRNSTIAGINATASYSAILGEVTKYNVQLNIFERLWAVRATIPPTYWRATPR